jgi:hypothetical protein
VIQDPGLTAQVTSTGVVQGSDVATGSLVRVGGENVGALVNKGTHTYGTNYDETYVSKDLTIEKTLPLRQPFSLKFTVITDPD